MRRVLVCGGRTYGKVHYGTPREEWPEARERALAEGDYLFAFMDRQHADEPIDLVVEGGADGADGLAEIWALRRDIEVETYDADWRKHGKAAGPIRNRRMLEDGKPDVVIAFKGGYGTRNMIRQAREAGVAVIRAGWSDGT